MTRERQVGVSYEIEVLDTDEEVSIARRADEKSLIARTVFTRFAPEGSCDDYCITAPDLEADDRDRAQHAEREWKQRFGSWTLPRMLEASRRDPRRVS